VGGALFRAKDKAYEKTLLGTSLPSLSSFIQMKVPHACPFRHG